MSVKKILTFVFIGILSHAALATTYYVDAINGNDAWTGNLPAPNSQNTDGAWKTIAKVNASAFSPGDTVLFRCGGSWRETLAPHNSGSAGAPITYGQYGADCAATNKPAIIGADVVTGWTLFNGNIYSAVVSQPVQQVFVDNKYVSLAHFPNKGYLSSKPNSVFLSTAANSPNCSSLIAGADLNTGGNSIVGARIHVRTDLWQIEDNVVSGQSGSTISLQSCLTTSVTQGWGYYLENQLWMLDSPGEWYWDAPTQTLYLWLPDGTPPVGHTIEASVRSSGIGASISPISDIVINGLSINKAGANGVYLPCTPLSTCPNPGNFTLKNLSIADSGDTGIKLEGNGATDSTVSRRIETSTISNSVRQGIQLAGVSNVAVVGNTVTDSGTVGNPVKSLAAIAYSRSPNLGYGLAESQQALNNTIVRSGYNGIGIALNSTIQNNDIEQSCLVLDDCGAIYTWNGNNPLTPMNSQVTGNVVRDVIGGQDGSPITKSYANGIYLDYSANAVTVTDNTIVNAANGIYMNQPFNNSISGNVIYGGRLSQISMNEGSWGGATQGAVHGNIVTNNTLFPTSDVPAINLGSVFDLVPCAASPCNPDYSSLGAYFGIFDSNKYMGLYSDRIVKETYDSGYSGVDKRQFVHSYTLQDWQALGRDANATLFYPYSIAPYSYTPLSTIYSATFNGPDYVSGSTSGWTAYSTSPATSLSLTGDSQTSCATGSSGGCLKFTPATSPTTYTANGTQYVANSVATYSSASFPFNLGETYLVKFMASSVQHNQNAFVTLRNPAPPYNLIGLNDQPFVMDSTWRQFAYVFTSNTTINPARMDFWAYNLVSDKTNTTGDQTMHIDNLAIKKVAINARDGSDDSYALTNSTGAPVSVPCPATDSAHCPDYTDTSGNTVAWPVVLNPYSSQIVVWSKNPLRDTDHDGTVDSADLCPQTIERAEAEGSGCAPTDLALTGTGSTTAYLGGPISYNYIVHNNGPDQGGGIQFTATLSGMTNVSAASSQGSCAVNVVNNTANCNLGALAVSGGATINVTGTATVVGSQTATAVIAGAATDPNATNNSVNLSTVVNPATDLSIAITDNPDPVLLSGTVTYTMTVTNNGPSAATNVVASGTLPTCTIGNLASGANGSCTSTVTPGSVGTLTQSMSVSGTEYDPNTANNSTNITTTVQAPDLIPTALIASVLGTNLVINDSVNNQGTGAAGAFAISYYLSSDTSYQAGTDTLICSRSVTNLVAGASNPASGTTQTTCAIPPVAAGPYYVLAVDDSGGVITESVESNNVLATTGTLNIGPDLVATALTASKSGNTVPVNDTVANQGNRNVSTTFTVTYYLSTDTVYQAGDIALASGTGGSGTCTRTLGSLNAGSSNSSGNITCYKPTGTLAGVLYYVLAVDDSGSVISEYDETNNTRATSGTIHW